jgi:hypothetical protein
MASLLVLVIISGCAAYQYLKGSFVKAFATIIIAIFASIAAFGYFEILANVIISRSNNSSYIFIVPWAQPLCFMLLFILTFAILQTASIQLIHKSVDLGFLPERIGRVICGILLGYIISGLLLTGLEMAPLPIKYPYERFDPTKLEPENPKKVLFNADGSATGLFSLVSNGSLSGKRSFAAIHPNYLDQLFMNRLISNIPLLSITTPAIKIPTPAVWPASETLRKQVDEFASELSRRGRLVDETTAKSVPIPGWIKSGYEPTIVRIGFKKTALHRDAKINAGIFSQSQIRLICKRKGFGQDPFAGTARNIFPIGYLKAPDQIQITPEIELQRDDFDNNSNEKLIDFVFCIPNGFEPTLVEFKLNSIVEIPPKAIVSADQAPPAAVFGQPSSQPEETTEEPERPETPQPSQAPSTQSENTTRRRTPSGLTESITGLQLDDEDQ